MKAEAKIKLKRFDQYRQGGTYDFMLPADYGPWVKHDEAVKLVKAERARARRIIKTESARLARMEMTSREGKAWITAKQNVLADILDALNRRTT